MINILITGSNGQLGSELRALAPSYPQYHFFFTDIAELDITDKQAIDNFVRENNINAIFNCAAYTAVDKAESEAEVAEKINHTAVRQLAEAAKKYNCQMIHISTDYVFDGTKTTPYTETDVPNPQSVYGHTKLRGEQALQVVNPLNSCIIRTSWVYSRYGHNFVKTMLRLGNEKKEIKVVADQVGSPTHAADLAQVMLDILPLLKNEQVELYHYTNDEVCSWAEFAHAIFELSAIPCQVTSISTAEYPTAAQRPKYSVLNKAKIKDIFGIGIPYWRDSLGVCLNVLN